LLDEVERLRGNVDQLQGEVAELKRNQPAFHRVGW
jgi:hypothetical protein